MSERDVESIKRGERLALSKPHFRYSRVVRAWVVHFRPFPNSDAVAMAFGVTMYDALLAMWVR